MGRTVTRAAKVLAATCLVLVVGIPALANHGAPARAPGDPCNGAPGFDINNVVTREVVDMIAAQNGGSTASVTHSLLPSAGHVALQIAETTVPIARATFEFAPTDSAWRRDSTNHPSYLTAIEAREDVARDADGDLVLGNKFVFFIPTDVVPDGAYVARLRGFRADGTEIGRLCVDATIHNAQGGEQMFSANRDPGYEAIESGGANVGFKPQPVLWFPAAEPSALQRAGYSSTELRIEFVEALSSVKVEREENLPAPTGLAGVASATGGSLATGTYFYKVSALNPSGETLPSTEFSVPVVGPTGSVSLTWDPVAGASGYRIYRGTASGGQDVFHSSSTTSFTDTNAVGTPGSPNPPARAKIWVDYSALLTGDDFSRPHFAAGGRMDETPLEAFANEKVWGPGYRFGFSALPGETLPNERLRITAVDQAAKTFCGVYSFAAAAGGSFLTGTPAVC